MGMDISHYDVAVQAPTHHFPTYLANKLDRGVSDPRVKSRGMCTSLLSFSTGSDQDNSAPLVDSAIDALPEELFAVVAGFLTGYDLVKLSHASPALFKQQLHPDSKLWEARVKEECSHVASQAWLQRSSSKPSSANTLFFQLSRLWKHCTWAIPEHRGFQDQSKTNPKRAYLSPFSIRFPGREQGPRTRYERGGAVEIPAQASSLIKTNSFSLEIWFALQPTDTGKTHPTLIGGVLLGGQSKHWTVGDEPRYQQPLVFVDPSGALYCSVTDSKVPVTASLQLQQWYHLVLTYDDKGDTKQGSQSVYLDGKLVHTSVGSRHRDMKELQYMQLGTGTGTGMAYAHMRMSTDSTSGETSLEETSVGWYGFNGLVAGCRVFRGVLSLEQVAESRRSEGSCVVDAEGACVWSLMEDADALFYGAVTCVQTARPRERYCTEVYGEVQLPGPKVPYIFRKVPC